MVKSSLVVVVNKGDLIRPFDMKDSFFFSKSPDKTRRIIKDPQAIGLKLHIVGVSKGVTDHPGGNLVGSKHGGIESTDGVGISLTLV